VQRPENPNFLSPIGFTFKVMRLPNVNFFVQSCTLPSTSVSFVEFQNPFNKITRPSKMQFSDFELTFKIDEDFNNYLEIHKWMEGLGFPDEFAQHAKLRAQPTGFGEMSDCSLVVLSSAKNANMQVLFKDAFPIELTSVNFDSTDEDVNYVTATCTFRCLRFEISKVEG